MKKQEVAKKMTVRQDAVLPGYKKKKVDIEHSRDDRGVVVSFKPKNYIRKHKTDFEGQKSYKEESK